jgi:hypothetical protein
MFSARDTIVVEIGPAQHLRHCFLCMAYSLRFESYTIQVGESRLFYNTNYTLNSRITSKLLRESFDETHPINFIRGGGKSEEMIDVNITL